jgi:DNA-binding response OmpR family regulator
MRLLLIEDDPELMYGLKRGLESHGFSVDAIGDPNDAVLLFALGKYDFTLLNIVVDSTTGFRIANKLKEIDPKLKFCFIAKYWTPEQASGEDHLRFKDACFVEKPISLTELIGKINQVLAKG